MKKIVLWSVAILYLAGIFMFSNQTGDYSNSISKSITKKIEDYVTLPAFVRRIDAVNKMDHNFILRKIGHFLEFLFLALLLYVAFVVIGAKSRQAVLLSLIMCAILASSDELHQIFVKGRSPRYQDVIIDVLGSLTGLCIFMGVMKVKVIVTRRRK